MKLPARKIAAPCLLLLAINAASAAVLTLSTSTAYPLASQSACASDPGCQHQAGAPVESSPGHLAGQGIVPASANDMNYFTSSFAAGSAAGDALQSPDVPTYVIDAADKFTGDDDLRWKVKLRLLQTYTSMRALVSLADITQNNAQDAGNIMSGQNHEISTAGANAGYAASGTVTDLRGLCVARDGSYNTVGAATQRECPAGSIYVNAIRSASMAEYAAFAQSVVHSAKGATTSNALHPVDLRYSRNEPGPKQYWRCSECDVDQTSGQEPGLLLRILGWIKDPIVMLLLALAGVAALVVDAVAKARRA